MRVGARGVAVLAGLALLGTVPVVSVGGAAAGPVEDAQHAARRIPFTARIEIDWTDKDSFHTAEMTVRSVGGNLRLQAAVPGVGDETDSLVVPSGDLLLPALERKYEVDRSDGPVVAGRTTDRFVLTSSGKVREELSIDRATGLVLRRQVNGPAGTPVRVVTVLQLDTAPVPDSSAATTSSSGPRSIRVGSVPAAFRGPAELPGGYTRVAVYRHGRLVQLLYSDGLHGLSLFSQPGRLSSASLPRGGEMVRIGAAAGVHYTWPGGDVVAWQAGPVVHTLVGDGTEADLLAAAVALPAAGGTSLLGRLRQTSRMVAELVSGGR